MLPASPASGLCRACTLNACFVDPFHRAHRTTSSSSRSATRAPSITDLGVKVFELGSRDVSFGTLNAIASDESKAQFMDDVFKLAEYLISLEAELCNESPP